MSTRVVITTLEGGLHFKINPETVTCNCFDTYLIKKSQPRQYSIMPMIVTKKEVKNIRGSQGTIIRSSRTHFVVLINKRDLTYDRIQSKEGFVASQLKQWARDGKIPMYTSHNKKIAGCSFRPDFVYDMTTHIVVLEIDEYQHSMQFSSRLLAYRPKSEFQRMRCMSTAFGKPTIILRCVQDLWKNLQDQEM